MKTRLTIIGLVALVALAAIWFFNSFERVTERQWIGPHGEAQRNPFLAAQRTLERLGMPAREARSLADLRNLPADGVLVLPDRRDSLSPEARQQLIEWIERGGYLITEDEHVQRVDPLLDALGVTRKPTQGGAPAVIEVRLPNVERPLNVKMHAMQSIDTAQPAMRVQSKLATHLVYFERGRGRVTVLNDLQFMTNRALGEHDHAEFLWGLVRLGAPGTIALFYNNPQKLSLWQWLTEHAWAVLASGAALIALWLWRIGPRFGPLAPDPDRVRRSLLEHLRASGRFQWNSKRSNGGARLAEAARELAWRRLVRAHPDLASASRSEVEARLAALFGLDKNDAQRLAVGGGASSGAEFLHTIRLYQTVHERMAHQRAHKNGEEQ